MDELTLNKIRRALTLFLETTEYVWDGGPPGEGWQSDEMHEARDLAEDLLKTLLVCRSHAAYAPATFRIDLTSNHLQMVESRAVFCTRPTMVDRHTHSVRG